jgi:hypothetical protein
MAEDSFFIDGETAKRFRIYRADIDHQPLDCIAEYEIPEEVHAHKRRLDWKYVVFERRKAMTYSEFSAMYPPA